MKGIILAGGKGTRLYPATRVVSKHLLPVHDKPMIYYSLSVLMLSGIRDIMVISTPEALHDYMELFGDGTHLGITMSYESQDEPRGIADAFVIGKDFIGAENVCLILGDNIFYGHEFTSLLQNTRKQVENKGDAVIFAYYVNNPERYGVVAFDNCDKIVSIEEKPVNPKSSYAVTGLYFYDNDVVEYASQLTPSRRGELEITDINMRYLQMGRLNVEFLGRGFAWFDTGTHQALRESAEFIASIEERQSLKIGCIEEIAYRHGYIDADQLKNLAMQHDMNGYGKYLMKLVEQDDALHI